MDAEKAFVTLTVLGILNKAQAFLPFSVHYIVQVRHGEGWRPFVHNAYQAHCQQGGEMGPWDAVRSIAERHHKWPSG
jgi:hypothetical protein